MTEVPASSRAATRWPAMARHRVGTLEIGDAVVVVAASAHRVAAFMRLPVRDREIKRRVPIWKREHYVDGTTGWVVRRCPQVYP
jgi:molybdopterin synthase catalytic subunit